MTNKTKDLLASVYKTTKVHLTGLQWDVHRAIVANSFADYLMRGGWLSHDIDFYRLRSALTVDNNGYIIKAENLNRE